jgi:predicted tellurium resistance membrane protein TerC
MHWISDPHIWFSFITLFFMEIVLGIDNVVFISLLTNELPTDEQKKGRILGVGFALIIRILFLSFISWIMSLTIPLFNVAEWFGTYHGNWHKYLSISGRDIILIAGGCFLIIKSNKGIYESLKGIGKQRERKVSSLWRTVLQVGLMDIILGLDSVITAVGIANHLGVMIAAVVSAMFLMLLSLKGLSSYVEKHPSIKLLALAFLLLIGVSLIAEGIALPIPKGYIYFAMFFAVFVEVLLLRLIKRLGLKFGK